MGQYATQENVPGKLKQMSSPHPLPVLSPDHLIDLHSHCTASTTLLLSPHLALAPASPLPHTNPVLNNPPQQPWASDWTSSVFSFLICKVEMKIVPTSSGLLCRLSKIVHVRLMAQSLAHNKSQELLTVCIG